MDTAMDGEGMDVSGAQLSMQAFLNASLNVNESFWPGIQDDAFLDTYNNVTPGLETISNDELFASQITPEPSFKENSMYTVGAGPLPTDFGMLPVQERNYNGVSDFTKRRNWPQRIIEEIKDFLHILTPDGRIIFVSASVKQLTGYSKEELKDKFIIDYIHPDDSGLFIREFNESIASGTPLRIFFRFKKKDQTHTIFELHGHPNLCMEKGASGTTIDSNSCKGYFMMARPYLSTNATLLDSFLEHKMENQRLLKRIDDLRREEAGEEENSHQKWLKQLDQSEVNSESTVGSVSTIQDNLSKNIYTNAHDSLSMPPPTKPIKALTKKALEESNASLEPDSIKDKMERYEGVSHSESIEMLTGLRYREGERSLGISTGARSPILIKGDAGISIPLDKEGRNDKKRKIKLLDEYVCTDCGTLDSPEWRKGPSGPKTLCNACGLRWAKREKKKTPKLSDSVLGVADKSSLV
ncbi:Cutinase gene palindrome-binding protein [Golovinomyces cichoracearum]|uniref:Cutinase gene palindrome-binding protein n=1 Tax=Golovinomyces cichoracearum TaxID=62708 RepID=A0A420IYZ5_9PEZI|nr:Cutinase gene palindrome-binding protein [Golovinomyces cichoracearum]